MQDVKVEISKEEYTRYKFDPAQYRRDREKTVPIVVLKGYGWYGVECHESNGHYYRVDKIGDSCD